jgi:hypothetical protein
MKNLYFILLARTQLTLAIADLLQDRGQRVMGLGALDPKTARSHNSHTTCIHYIGTIVTPRAGACLEE